MLSLTQKKFEICIHINIWISQNLVFITKQNLKEQHKKTYIHTGGYSFML